VHYLLEKHKKLLVLLFVVSVIVSFLLLETMLFLLIYRIIQAYENRNFQILLKLIWEKILMEFSNKQLN
jgi:hypothetical protein